MEMNTFNENPSINDSIESVDLKEIEVSGEKPIREPIKFEENLV